MLSLPADPDCESAYKSAQNMGGLVDLQDHVRLARPKIYKPQVNNVNKEYLTFAVAFQLYSHDVLVCKNLRISDNNNN